VEGGEGRVVIVPWRRMRPGRRWEATRPAPGSRVPRSARRDVWRIRPHGELSPVDTLGVRSQGD